MIGTIFVSSYLISCGYNYVTLNYIRKDVQSECRTKLLNSGFQIVDKQFDSILECSKIVDDVGVGMLCFLPFTSFWMSYRNMTGKTKTRYYQIAEHLLDSDMIRRLERAKIILPVNFWDVTFDFLPHCMEESMKRKIGEIEQKNLISEKGNIDDCFEQVREQSEEELVQTAKCLKKRL